MIRLFRKILKHLSSDWFRYGFETLAIVVGILVAFGLESWNESRKEAVLEKDYLLRLADDLTADLIEIDTTIKYASEYIAVGNKILEILGQDYMSDINKSNGFSRSHDSPTVSFINQAVNLYDKEITEENFGSSLGYLFDERTVDMNNFTYTELMSTGNFEVIKNTTLRKNLSTYYLNFSAALDIQINLEVAVDEYNKLLQKNHIPIINSLTFNDLSKQLTSVNGQELQTSLRNMIWNHAYSISLFEYEFRPVCLGLMEDIYSYLKQL
jgi:hypothetical protein